MRITRMLYAYVTRKVLRITNLQLQTRLNNHMGQYSFEIWRKLQSRTWCIVSSAQKGRLPSQIYPKLYYLSLKWHEQRTLMNFRDASDRWFFKGNSFFITKKFFRSHLFLNFQPIPKSSITLIFRPFKEQFLQPHTQSLMDRGNY